MSALMHQDLESLEGIPMFDRIKDIVDYVDQHRFAPARFEEETLAKLFDADRRPKMEHALRS